MGGRANDSLYNPEIYLRSDQPAQDGDVDCRVLCHAGVARFSL